MQLEYLDKCTIVDLDNTIIDPETGDTNYVILCQNQACDYQPARTRNVNGTLVAESPKLFLPFDFEYTNLLSRNLTVIISRFRKVGKPQIWTFNEELQEYEFGGVIFHPKNEDGKEIRDKEFKKYKEYTECATDINFKKDFKQGNPDKKHLVSAKIEDWWEVMINDPYLDGIQIELREVTYL